jgi:hypothetical protein
MYTGYMGISLSVEIADWKWSKKKHFNRDRDPNHYDSVCVSEHHPRYNFVHQGSVLA